MEIRRGYEFRAEYSKEVISNSQTMELAEDTPREAVKAETILLGVKVQFTVMQEVYLSNLIDDEEYEFNLRKVYFPLMARAQKEIIRMTESEIKYEGLSDFMKDLKGLKRDIDRQLKKFDKDEDDDED